jgi:hypothetical protein
MIAPSTLHAIEQYRGFDCYVSNLEAATMIGGFNKGESDSSQVAIV